MLTTQNRIAWPMVSSDLWRDMQVGNWSGDTRRVTWRPAAHVTESDAAFLLRLELPGVDPETIELDLDGELLTIAGERQPMHDEGQRVLVSELGWGRFLRRFRLGSEADREAIQAAYHDGLLEITVPKRQEARPRRIPVSVSA